MKKIIFITCSLLFSFLIIFICYLIDTNIEKNKSYKKYLKEELDKINEEITYNIPKEFNTKDKLNYFYSTSDIDCRFEFNNEEKNRYYEKNLEDFLSNNIYVSLDFEVSEIIKDKTNNLNYLLITTKKSDKLSYYYAFETNKYYYIFEYNIIDYKNGDREDIDTNLCYTAKNKILNSIKIKK